MINILVCDDDKDIVDAIEIYLAPEGYRILKAYDGIQAIEMMRKNDILDLHAIEKECFPQFLYADTLTENSFRKPRQILNDL